MGACWLVATGVALRWISFWTACCAWVPVVDGVVRWGVMRDLTVVD